MRSFQEMISAEEPIGTQTIPHGVGEAGQLDAMCAHHADAPKFQAFGELENRAPFEQRGEGGVRRQRRCVASQRSRHPGRRDLAADDALAGIGLKPVDAGRLVRQPLPDRQEQACHDMDGAVGELGHFGEFRLPGRGEAFAVGLRPMAFGHHLQRKAVMLHRPDQPHAPFDLAVIEHEARSRHLNGGPAGALVDQQDARRNRRADRAPRPASRDGCAGVR